MPTASASRLIDSPSTSLRYSSGRERAAAERLRIDFRLGDAEQIPFADESFDAVISVFGSMFAPDPYRAAAELMRVPRPGGTIALASWTPEGFIGSMFKTVASHVPPPPGLASPLLWGTEEHVADLFGTAVTWTHHRRTFTFRFTSAEAFVETFATYYGPTLKALEAAAAYDGGYAIWPAYGLRIGNPAARRRRRDRSRLRHVDARDRAVTARLAAQPRHVEQLPIVEDCSTAEIGGELRRLRQASTFS